MGALYRAREFAEFPLTRRRHACGPGKSLDFNQGVEQSRGGKGFFQNGIEARLLCRRLNLVATVGGDHDHGGG